MKYFLPLVLLHSFTAEAQSYQGHGSDSLSAETFNQYAPKPLPKDLSRKIQSIMDIRATGLGLPSDDGKRLYFGWSVTGIPQVWKLSAPLGFPQQMTGGEDATSVVAITQDQKQLIISRDRKGEEYPGLYLQSVEGGALKFLQHKPKVQTQFQILSRDGQKIYFRANDIKPDSYALYAFELKSAKIQPVFSEDGIWNVAGESKHGTLLLTKDTGALSSEWFEYHLASKKLTPIIGQGEKEEYNLAFANKKDDFIVLTPKIGEYRRLYRMSLSDKKLMPISPEIKFEVSSVSVDRDSNKILYQVNEGGYNKLFALDGTTFKPLKLPSLADAEHVYGGLFSNSGRFVALGTENAKSPRRSFIWDFKTSRLTTWLTPSSPELDTKTFSAATLEFYPARDGVKIPMFVRRSATCEKNLCPVIVSFHGGPEGQSIPGFSARSQLFVDEGFIFVEPNVRGSLGYGKTWLAADDGPKRLSVITDIEDCAKFIRDTWSKGGKAPKIGIHGGSYGGYSALIGMTMFAGAYDAGVAIVGMSNLVTFLNNTAPYRRILRISEYGDPEKDKDALTKLSPITYLDKVKGPLLIIQGASDPRVPAGEAIQMQEAMKSKGLSSELIIFADEGHGSQKRENRVLETGHSLQFFKQHLQKTL